jgi:hypothetical protein
LATRIPKAAINPSRSNNAGVGRTGIEAGLLAAEIVTGLDTVIRLAPAFSETVFDAKANVSFTPLLQLKNIVVVNAGTTFAPNEEQSASEKDVDPPLTFPPDSVIDSEITSPSPVVTPAPGSGSSDHRNDPLPVSPLSPVSVKLVSKTAAVAASQESNAARSANWTFRIVKPLIRAFTKN